MKDGVVHVAASALTPEATGLPVLPENMSSERSWSASLTKSQKQLPLSSSGSGLMSIDVPAACPNECARSRQTIRRPRPRSRMGRCGVALKSKAHLECPYACRRACWSSKATQPRIFLGAAELTYQPRSIGARHRPALHWDAVQCAGALSGSFFGETPQKFAKI